jgi:Reverse transcriptase (RNA-dependent DNA polymerase)
VESRLNVDGGKQIHGIDYWETYAPVATWTTIRLILIMGVKEKWCMMQLDFVQAYPQAPVETELYIDIPKGFVVNGRRDGYALRVLRNVYGQKQAGRVWNQYLVKGLLQLGFTQSQHDMCLFWRKLCVMIIYTDDTIITGPIKSDVEESIELIASKFKITTSDKIEDFLGVNIARLDEDTFKLSQPHLIKSILSDLGLNSASKSKPTPSVKGDILHAHADSADHH